MQSRGGRAFSLSPALHGEKAAGLGPCHPWLLSAGLPGRLVLILDYSRYTLVVSQCQHFSGSCAKEALSFVCFDGSRFCKALIEAGRFSALCCGCDSPIAFWGSCFCVLLFLWALPTEPGPAVHPDLTTCEFSKVQNARFIWSQIGPTLRCVCLPLPACFMS